LFGKFESFWGFNIEDLDQEAVLDQEELWIQKKLRIKWDLRSFELTFRTSRSAGRVPQLAALALHTARSTVRGFTVRSKFGCLAVLLGLDYSFSLGNMILKPLLAFNIKLLLLNL
jgi:hypothetical protein